MLLLSPLLLLTIGSPTASACALPTQSLVIRSVGLGQVESLDPRCERAWVSAHAHGMVIEGRHVAASTRLPMLPAQAQTILETLLKRHAVTHQVDRDLYSNRSMTLMDHGSVEEQAHHLRDLYVTRKGDMEKDDTLAFWEQLLIGELAYVLGIEAQHVATQLRSRHRPTLALNSG